MRLVELVSMHLCHTVKMTIMCDRHQSKLTRVSALTDTVVRTYDDYEQPRETRILDVCGFMTII